MRFPVIKGKLASNVLLWLPSHGNQTPRRKIKTYIDQLMYDTGCLAQELPINMDNRNLWKECVMLCQGSST